MIPPRGKASFKLIFLPSEEGNVENTLFINTSAHGLLSYQVSSMDTAFSCRFTCCFSDVSPSYKRIIPHSGYLGFDSCKYLLYIFPWASQICVLSLLKYSHFLNVQASGLQNQMQTAVFFCFFFLLPHATRVVMMIIKVQSSSILSYVKGLKCSDRHVLSVCTLSVLMYWREISFWDMVNIQQCA